MDAHVKGAKVGLKVSVFKELPVWHCGQIPTGKTQEAEREVKAVGREQRPGSLVSPQKTKASFHLSSYS